MMRRFLAAAVLAGTAACSNRMGSETMMGTGTTAMSVSAVTPLPNTASASRADTIRMWLDMPMDSASCATRFTLHMGDSTGPAVPGRMTFMDGYRQMMFVPDSLMRPGTQYFAHMRDSVMMREPMHANGMGGMMAEAGMGMMTGRMPAGVGRMSNGVGWAFTTGS